MNTPDEILTILDRGAEDGVFPMLDNPYVYLAASRLTLYRSDDDWALVFEIFGFAPRAGLPDLSVVTFASRPENRNPPEKYRTVEAYQNYLAQHPHDDSRFFYPIARSGWQDPTNDALVAAAATEVVVRNETIQLPTVSELERYGVRPSRPPRILVSEVCRLLAETRRGQILATDNERRTNVPPRLVEILRLDDWTHPDLRAGEKPSDVESFRQMATVLASGNVDLYRPTSFPNTHWENWPDGGRS